MHVPAFSGATAIAAGGYHTVVRKPDGSLWAWGRNDYGQLGNGNTTSRSTPVQVSGLSGVTKIAGGLYHTVALRTDGTVWGWGRSDSGQLGDGVDVPHLEPVKVVGLRP